MDPVIEWILQLGVTLGVVWLVWYIVRENNDEETE